ncbi:LAQU0S02e09912g1_1 [Lachancea quebecensis]|uniref:DASH complex subunit DUO1 n=1 Tax=Lachancea quebecensis TaxID=1654605 RepID=A0A0P1KNY1_9SACH|nr:LAQU0S02e09912g1_1 [Lachancea quebecensis]
MSDNVNEDSNINKLIPEIFDQMRSNLSLASTAGGFKPFVSSKSSSSLATQSLLEESKCLDKIIPVIQKLNSSLSSSGPQHLKRIKETCESSNKILDAWIKIQSQAGYIHELMSDQSYLEYVSAAQENEALTAEVFVQRKETQVASLKRTLEEKQQLRESAKKEQEVRGSSDVPSSQRGRRVFDSKKDARGGMKKPTGIPRSSTRVSKPPLSRATRSSVKRPSR